MTLVEMPIQTPDLVPFQRCPPEVSPEECTRIKVAVRALDDLVEGRFIAGTNYFSDIDCRGCALGSLAFSITLGDGGMVDRAKKVPGGPRRGLTVLVGTIFGCKEAEQIESAYEGWHTYGIERSMFDTDRVAVDSAEWTTPEHRRYRLRSILSNIILNKGHFDPTTRMEPIA